MKKIIFFTAFLILIIACGIWFNYLHKNSDLILTEEYQNIDTFTSIMPNTGTLQYSTSQEWMYIDISGRRIGFNKENATIGFGKYSQVIGEIIPVAVAKNPNNHQWYICPITSPTITTNNHTVNAYGEHKINYSGYKLTTCYMYDNYGSSINTMIQIKEMSLECSTDAKCKISAYVNFTNIVPEDTGFGFIIEPTMPQKFRYVNYGSSTIDLASINKFSVQSYELALTYNQSGIFDEFAKWDFFDMLNPFTADEDANISTYLEVIQAGGIKGIFMATYGYGSKREIGIDPRYELTNIITTGTAKDILCENKLCHLNLSEKNITLYVPFSDNASASYVYNWKQGTLDGTIVGTPLYTNNGKFGGAMHFDAGETDAINFGTAMNFLPYSSKKPFTISIWVKWDGTAYSRYLFGAQDSQSHFTGIRTNNDGNYGEFIGGIWDGSTTVGVDCNLLDPTPGVWYHVVMTTNGTLAKIYVNGQHCTGDDTAHPNGIGEMGNEIFWISGQSSSITWNGTLDEVIVWNGTQLTDNQIKQLYNATYPLFKKRGNYTIDLAYLNLLNKTSFLFTDYYTRTDGKYFVNNGTGSSITIYNESFKKIGVFPNTYSYYEGLTNNETHIFVNRHLAMNIGVFNLSGYWLYNISLNAGNTYAYANCYANNTIYVLDSYDYLIYKYKTDGTYKGYINLSDVGSYQGFGATALGCNNQRFFIFSPDYGILHEYNLNGTKTGFTYDAASYLSGVINNIYMTNNTMEISYPVTYRNTYSLNTTFNRANVTSSNGNNNNGSIYFKIWNNTVWSGLYNLTQGITELSLQNSQTNSYISLNFTSNNTYFSPTLVNLTVNLSYIETGVDETAPSITTSPVNISSNVTIYWTVGFDEAANMTGTYGTAPSYDDIGTFTNTTKATSLSVNITGLTNNTKYGFNITSFCDSSGNCNESGYLFNLTTLNYILPAADSCTCPGYGTGHIFDLSDGCIVSSCEAGIISFTGSGNPVRCTGLWHAYHINASIGVGLVNTTAGCNLNITGG